MACVRCFSWRSDGCTARGNIYLRCCCFMLGIERSPLLQDDNASGVRTYVIGFILLAAINFVAAVLSQGLLGIAGEKLTCRMRSVCLHCSFTVRRNSRSALVEIDVIGLNYEYSRNAFERCCTRTLPGTTIHSTPRRVAAFAPRMTLVSIYLAGYCVCAARGGCSVG